MHRGSMVFPLGGRSSPPCQSTGAVLQLYDARFHPISDAATSPSGENFTHFLSAPGVVAFPTWARSTEHRRLLCAMTDL